MAIVVNARKHKEVKQVESIYEAECLCTLENLREMITNTRKTGYVIYFYSCYIMLFIFGVIIPIYNDKMVMAIIVSVILCILGIVYFIMPRVNAKKQYEAYKVMCEGKELRTRVIVYDDKVQNIDVCNEKYTEVLYSEIKKIVSTENLYNLLLKNGSVIMLDKREFVKGDMAECYKYINERLN